jgi:hypothetical protein
MRHWERERDENLRGDKARFITCAGTARALVTAMRAVIVLACCAACSDPGQECQLPQGDAVCADCGPDEIRYVLSGGDDPVPAIFADGSVAVKSCNGVEFFRPDLTARLHVGGLPQYSTVGPISSDASGGVYLVNTVLPPPDDHTDLPVTTFIAMDADGKTRWKLDGIGGELVPGPDGAYLLTGDTQIATLTQYASADGSVVATWTGRERYWPTAMGEVYTRTSTGIELLDHSGAVEWTKTISSPTSPVGVILTPTSDGGAIVAGTPYQSSTEIDFGDFTLPIEPTVVLDQSMFVAWIDATGKTLWAHAFRADDPAQFWIAASGDRAVLYLECRAATELLATPSPAMLGFVASFDATGLVHATPLVAAAMPPDLVPEVMSDGMIAAPDGSVWLSLTPGQLQLGSEELEMATGWRWYVNFVP